MYVAEPRMFLAIAESRHRVEIHPAVQWGRPEPPRRRTVKTPAHGPLARAAKVLARMRPALS